MSKPFIFRAWFINRLRGIFRKYPPYYNTKNKHKEEYFIKSKKGKDMRRVKFLCNGCGNKFPSGDVSVDHIIPVSPSTGFPLLPSGGDDWVTYIERLFCSEENLQLLCKECHDAKSLLETKTRVIKKARKKKTK